MDFRSASLQAWSGSAAAWGELADDVDRQLAPATEWMFESAALAPGERVLELAAGPGTLSARAARAVGDEGHVICSDFSASMVEVARKRLASERNVEVRVLDAEALDLADATVDVVLCRCGFMLMADPAAAFRESARTLVSGGRIALAVWGGAGANPWASLPMRAVGTELGVPPPPPDAPGLWALADQERLKRLLVEAGFDAIRIELLDGDVEYPSAAAWLDRVSRLAGPLRALLDRAGADGRRAVERELEATAAQFARAAGTVVLPQQLVVASGRRR